MRPVLVHVGQRDTVLLMQREVRGVRVENVVVGDVAGGQFRRAIATGGLKVRSVRYIRIAAGAAHRTGTRMTHHENVRSRAYIGQAREHGHTIVVALNRHG